MADQKININIGSSYNGEGMNKALGSIDKLSKTTGKVAGAVGRLGGSFEALGGSAGKAIGNVSNLMGALATGGLWGGIVAGLTTSIALFQDAMAMMDEMKKRAEENAKEWKKAEENAKKWIQAIQENELNKIQQHGEKLVSTLNRLAEAEARVTRAQNDLNHAMEETKFAELQADIAGSINAASSPDEKARARSLGNIRLAEAQQAMALEEQKVIVEQKRVALENAKAVEMHTKATIEAAEMASGLKADHTKLDLAIKAREEAEIQLTLAEEKQKAATIKAKTNVDNAKAAHDELIKAQREAMGALLQEASDRSARASAERDIAEIQHNAAEEIKRIDDEIKDAKEDLKLAIGRTKEAYDAASAIANGGIWNPNNAPVGGRANARRGSSANNVDNQPWQDFSKPEGWDQRWAQTHEAQAREAGIEAGLSKKEQREYDRLAGKAAKSPEQMQDSDWKKLHDLAAKDPQRKAQKAQEAQEKAQKKIEDLQKKREEAERQMKEDVAEIRKHLEELGLK